MDKKSGDLAEEIKAITHLSEGKLAELKELLNEIKRLRQKEGDKPSEKLKGFIAKLQPYCRELVLKGGKVNILGTVNKEELAIKGLPEYMKTIIETWLFMGTIPDDDLQYWALPSKEHGKTLTVARNYAIDLNLLRIPAFAFRKTPKTKNYVAYKETRIIHGRRFPLETRVGTAQGALTAFDYMVFRGVCSFIKERDTDNGKQYFSVFTMGELLKRLGKNMEDYYKVAYEALRKLPTLHIIYSHYHTKKETEPEYLTINYFEKAYTPGKNRPEREHVFLFNNTTGRVFSNKYYREFVFENIDRLSEPLTMRLYELLETELYKKSCFNISIEKLAGRIPLQDKNLIRRDNKLLQALKRLKPIFEYEKASKGYLKLWKGENLFKTPATENGPEPQHLPEPKYIEPENFL